jgi:hypothetical protein
MKLGAQPSVRAQAPTSRKTVCQSSFTGAGVSPPSGGRHHFLHIDDFSTDEVKQMLRNAARAKTAFYERDETFKPFAGQSMAMIFTKPSARTRISFETVRHCLSATEPPEAPTTLSAARKLNFTVPFSLARAFIAGIRSCAFGPSETGCHTRHRQARVKCTLRTLRYMILLFSTYFLWARCFVLLFLSSLAHGRWTESTCASVTGILPHGWPCPVPRPKHNSIGEA